MNLSELWKRRLKARPRSTVMPVWFDIADITFRRYRNLRLMKKEFEAGKTKLRSVPARLIIEATNVCNLECPGCFTGLGENGRVRSQLSLDFFKKIMNEIGDRVVEVEFFNWGEPLLCKSIYAMIEDANRRGIGTHVTSNFSIPFDEQKAEALVRSGLKNFGVSLDGATQEPYEKYRRGGDIALVLRNARMVAEAKSRLGSVTPKMVWSFHVFEHNVHEMDLAREMADEIGFDEIDFVKGYVIGAEWKSERIDYMLPDFNPERCPFLWAYAVIHNDGGVAPCAGAFYREDDLGRISVKPGDGGAASFMDVWNSKAFQDARAMFLEGANTLSPSLCGTLCADCPKSDVWRRFQQHVAEGHPKDAFVPGVGSHEGYNFFLTRRPSTRDTRKVLKPERQRAPAEA